MPARLESILRVAALVSLPSVAACALLIGVDEGTERTETQTASGGAGGAGPDRCAAAGDCPAPIEPCLEPACIQGVCGASALPAGTPCGAAGGVVCDGAGRCAACNDGIDCASGVCVAHQCQTPTCFDEVKNGAETSVDCGGPDCALRCADGRGCAIGSDCRSGVCGTGVCAAPTCSDGVKNGTEADVDCGSACTKKCATGQTCIDNADCASNECRPNKVCM